MGVSSAPRSTESLVMVCWLPAPEPSCTDAAVCTRSRSLLLTVPGLLGDGEPIGVSCELYEADDPFLEVLLLGKRGRPTPSVLRIVLPSEVLLLFSGRGLGNFSVEDILLKALVDLVAHSDSILGDEGEEALSVDADGLRLDLTGGTLSVEPSPSRTRLGPPEAHSPSE